MKPNKETEYNDFIKWSEDLCNKRHKKMIELRKEKAGNNPFKKWFYLGKEASKYDVEVDGKFFAQFRYKKDAKDYIKREQPKGIIKLSPAIYSIEEHGDAPYDKLRWKAIRKWHKKIEKYGLEIKRPYFFYGKEKYYIWNSHLEYGRGYRKFCSSWWKDQFNKILDMPKYHYKTCWYDYFDLFTSLIVKLTIKGLYIGLYGNAVNHKEQMHEIWECRRELINAYNFDDYYEWKYIKEKVNEKFGIDYDEFQKGVERTSKIDNLTICDLFYIEQAKSNIDAVNEFVNSLTNEEFYTLRAEKMQECMNNAFALLGKYICNMWD